MAEPYKSPLGCFGKYEQGGFLICKATPGARFRVDDVETVADKDGYAVLGFDRDAPATAVIEARDAGGVIAAYPVEIAPREYPVQRIDGLPQETVAPTDPKTLARIAREKETKAHGFASRAARQGFLEPWIWPIDGIQSSAWGNQRVLNGVPGQPHYGVDIAAPEGTPIHAPASGVVALAEPDMHFEGGLVMIDHGQGLISLYLHMSRVDVKPGDVLVQGDTIGAVGKKGRATGPHLCWRMKWRDRNLDPSLVPMMPLKPISVAQR